MSNHYFQFKQFRIEQERCAMKVCTDSCLFGAWIKVDQNVRTIVDIGTGTGLLSLMLAQKCKAAIQGIEIDEQAFLQTAENFEHSLWKDRLSVSLGDVKTHDFQQLFDFVVCNPPFFKNETGSKTHGEKIAKHSLHLTLPNLLASVEKILKPDGKFALLLPYFRKDEMERLAAIHDFFPENTLLLKHSPAHDFFRYAAVFSKHHKVVNTQEEICIRNNINGYSEEAAALLKPYYLYL